MCRMKTKDNKCCVFPFVYKGKTYDSCITARANSLWCALSPSYDEDKKYGYCRGTLFNLSKKRPSNPLLESNAHGNRFYNAIIRASVIRTSLNYLKNLWEQKPFYLSWSLTYFWANGVTYCGDIFPFLARSLPPWSKQLVITKSVLLKLKCKGEAHTLMCLLWTEVKCPGKVLGKLIRCCYKRERSYAVL